MKECMKYIVYPLLFLLASCSSKPKYQNWEYVRLTYEEPASSNCIYKVQEVCHKPVGGVKASFFEGCYNWHKKRATLFEANTVFIQRAEGNKVFIQRAQSESEGVKSGFEGMQSGFEDGIASYYSCK